MNNISFKLLEEVTDKPPVFTQSTASLWDDEHISREMLKAHLDPELEGASRKHCFIDKSVNWIIALTQLKRDAKILDLGCGPGLYAERFAQLGYKVTGIDFSKRSINYAREQALKKDLDITYLYQDYLTIDFKNEFDLVLMIYCDFGVLSNEHRGILLQNVQNALKNNGKFIFDVFTPNRYSKEFENNKTWELHQNGGFWRPGPYICLNSHYNYPKQHTYLNQVIILDETEKVEVYRLWNKVYTTDSIQKVLHKYKFVNIGYFADVAGATYKNDSETLCIVAEK